MNKVTKTIYGFVAMAALSVAVACGGNGAKTTDPVKLGTLAAAVEKAPPAEAAQLLSKEGHDEASFRKEIEELMEDPDRVVKFSEAYKSAKG